jgi:GTPase Era involved in 16S rRNA processing
MSFVSENRLTVNRLHCNPALNVLIVGRANTGKTTLFTVLSNPPKNIGETKHAAYYVPDTPFSFIICHQTEKGVAFYDTLPLTGTASDDEYIKSLKQYEADSYNKFHVVIVCLPNKRVTVRDGEVIRKITSGFPHSIIIFHISHCTTAVSPALLNDIQLRIAYKNGNQLEKYKVTCCDCIEYQGNQITRDQLDSCNNNGKWIQVDAGYQIKKAIYFILHEQCWLPIDPVLVSNVNIQSLY